MDTANRNELLSLLSALVDDASGEAGLFDATHQRRLSELLCDDEARELYLQYWDLHADLVLQSGALKEPELKLSVGPPPGPRALTNRFWRTTVLCLIGLAAVCLLAFLGLRWYELDRPQMAAASELEEHAMGYAVVVGQSNVVWESASPLVDGALLPRGLMHLKSGILQLELFSGVSVIVQGEAQFSIQSPMEMLVSLGKIRAQVPEAAHGFTVRTSEGHAVDLGTEFALNVWNGHSEVHVLDGEVEWYPKSTPATESSVRRVTEGHAVRSSADGQSANIFANSQQFVGRTELRNQLQSDRLEKRMKWQQACQLLRKDPRLVAFYQTASVDPWSRRLPNGAQGTDASAGEGAVVAAARSVDRWGQADGALDFSPMGSRVRVSVPGEFHSLTLLCWVKINSLDRWYNSLFLTDGHDLHEPHWQIMDDGRLFFSVKKRDQFDTSKGEAAKHVFYSPPFWSSALSGKWIMIASVYDSQARQVTHYLNGEVLSQEAIPEEYLVQEISIGNASLCNWGLPELGWISGQPDESRFAVRNLNGSLDEFGLFSAALSGSEIRELYEHGKP